MTRALSLLGFATLLATSTVAAPTNDIDFGSPVGFIPNKGQIMDEHGRANPAVHYLFRGSGLNVQLRANGFSYEAWRPEENEADNEKDAKYRLHRIDVDLEGCNTDATWETSGTSTDVLNYYSAITGEDGITGVHHYQQVVRRGIYPFIDLVFKMEAGGVKYDFIVHPGGDPSAIRLRYQGARAALRSADGGAAISLSWNDGSLSDRVPLSYWEQNGVRESVAVQYVQHEADLFGFDVQGMNTPLTGERDLVIDPVPDLQWGTYYGTDDASGAFISVAIDEAGNVIAAGGAGITGLATFGTHDQTLSGTSDALLVKFNASGQRLWATYYGGSNAEGNSKVACDANNNIYLTGTTQSSSGIATPFTHQYTYTSGYNVYLVKFTPSGTRTWGTYFGHAQHQYVYALVVDGAGSPVIGGDAWGSGLATPGAADETNASGDGFVAKFTTGGQLSWATYLGGDYIDQVNGLSCDGTYIFAAGETNSPTSIATAGAHDATFGGGGGYGPDDAFLVKYSGLGQKLWGTYYGGATTDRGMTCAAELGTGNVYLAGRTTSTSAIATLFQHQTSLSGTEDGFLVKFNSSGVRQWGTYYGGTSGDQILGAAIGDLGRVFVVGKTSSSNGIATSTAEFPTYAGGQDVFAAGFSSSGDRLWGTYFGGPGTECEGGIPTAIAVSDLDFVIVGGTSSTTGIATPGAYQTNSGPLAQQTRFIAYFSSPFFFMKNATDEDASVAPIAMSATGSVIDVFLPAEMREATGTITVQIMDLQGRVVLDRAVPVNGARMAIDAGSITPGIYLVTLMMDEQRWSQRVFVAGQ